jgi:hypothetical protein
MNKQDQKIADAIWPQYSNERMERQRVEALQYLGDRYLLARPLPRLEPRVQR